MRRIQPGIESLSTPTLKLMEKGVSLLQNVRLLSWCAEIGISAGVVDPLRIPARRPRRV